MTLMNPLLICAKSSLDWLNRIGYHLPQKEQFRLSMGTIPNVGENE